MKTAKQYLAGVKEWLGALSFRTGVIVALSCVLFYALSFAQMLLPIPVAAKGVLWAVFFGMAKASQYGAILILGATGIKRIKHKIRPMKKIHIIFALFSILMTGCGAEEHADSTDAELDAAALAGRRDALRALESPHGTMAREEAFFAIRARETELRDAAHPSCADAYVRAAEAVLRDSLDF